VVAQHDVLHPRNRECTTSLHSHTAAKKINFLSIVEDIQGILDQPTILLEDQYLAQNHKNNTMFFKVFSSVGIQQGSR